MIVPLVFSMKRTADCLILTIYVDNVSPLFG